MELPKRYETVARLGARSSTGDPEGEITTHRPAAADPPPMPTGELRQRPPIYSAVKIRGERAYRRARRGERFEMPERIVTVYASSSSGASRRAARAFLIECSTGTYVRSLIADLGDAYCEAAAHRDRAVRGRAGARAAPSRRAVGAAAGQPISIEQALAALPQAPSRAQALAARKRAGLPVRADAPANP